MRKYHQGKFVPKNPDKYVGDVNNIIFRSSWERRAFAWADNNTSILKWASEEIIVPYVSPIDNRVHRYFVDMTVQYRAKNGETRIAMIEIKPHAQTMKPAPTKSGRITKRYLNEQYTYVVNKAKWKAAKAYCDKKGWDFIIADEYTLGIKKS